MGERHNNLIMVALAQAAAPYWETLVKIRDVLPEDALLSRFHGRDKYIPCLII